MKALFLVIFLISASAQAQKSIFAQTKLAPGTEVVLDDSIRVVQHFNPPHIEEYMDLDYKYTFKKAKREVKEGTPRLAKGTKIIVDKIVDGSVERRGSKFLKYTFEAHLSDCEDDCSITFGWSHLNSNYPIIYTPFQTTPSDVVDMVYKAIKAVGHDMAENPLLYRPTTSGSLVEGDLPLYDPELYQGLAKKSDK